MRLSLKQVPTIDDIQVLVRYAERSYLLSRLIATIRGLTEKIECRDGRKTVLVDVGGIYYFESVDKQTYAYCQQIVYQVGLRLYQVKEKLQQYGFVQVSKSCLLNLNMLESVRSLSNGKMVAALSNSEHITISRRYVPELKSAIRKGSQE